MKDLRLYWIRCWWRVIQSSYDHFHLQHWRVKVDCYVDFWIINDPQHDNYRKTKYFNRKLDVGENWMHSLWEYIDNAVCYNVVQILACPDYRVLKTDNTTKGFWILYLDYTTLVSINVINGSYEFIINTILFFLIS